VSTRASLAPFASPAFRLLFAGRFAANLANAIAPIVLAFAVLDLGGSASELGLVLAARTVPMVLLLLFGGVIADRLPRHRVVLTANVVSALTQALVAVLLFSGSAQLWHLAAIEAVNGASAAFLMPAASGLTPQTVPASQLQPANALIRLAINGAFVGGSAAAGGLVATVGPAWGFAADAVFFTVGAVLLGLIRLPPGDRVVTSNVLADLREGWTEFRSRTWVWAVVVQFAFVNMAGAAAFTTLGPVIADQSIGRGAWGLVIAAQTAGMIAGGLIALRTRWDRPLLVGVVVVLLEAPVLFMLGFEPLVVPLVVAAFVCGIGIEVFTVAWDVSLQSHVPPDRISRVYAYDWFGSMVFVPVGQALAGPLALAVGLETAPVVCGVVVVAATLAVLASPSVRSLRRIDDAVVPA
jgi:MFS family permease